MFVFLLPHPSHPHSSPFLSTSSQFTLYHPFVSDPSLILLPDQLLILPIHPAIHSSILAHSNDKKTQFNLQHPFVPHPSLAILPYHLSGLPVCPSFIHLHSRSRFHLHAFVSHPFLNHHLFILFYTHSSIEPILALIATPMLLFPPHQSVPHLISPSLTARHPSYLQSSLFLLLHHLYHASQLVSTSPPLQSHPIT